MTQLPLTLDLMDVERIPITPTEYAELSLSDFEAHAEQSR
jgi:hypothetical protein